MKLLNARMKLVTFAVASAVAGGAMVSTPAQAMNVSQNNVGQVLLSPYYTVKNGFDTFFSVVNTTNATAIFKIRFREALNSRETRDFNVILSPYDVWNGGVTSTGVGATIRTFDNSCTSPDKPSWTSTGTGGYQVDMTNANFSGANADGADATLARTQDGYFEVILMGVSTMDSDASANVIEYNAKHVAGVPRDCAKVDAAVSTAGAITTHTANFVAPLNILKGHVTYINVANGTAVDAEPTAIENFAQAKIIYTSSDNQPDLANGAFGARNPGNLINNGQPMAVTAISSQDTVTALLSADNVINEYASGSGAATSWVVTFPTKHFYADLGTAIDPALPPFAQNFDYDTGLGVLRGKSCDQVALAWWDRNEATATTGTHFSPYTPGSDSLCYEANVIDFNGASMFGAGVNHKAIDTTGVGTSGWLNLSLTNTGTIGGADRVVTGLPVIGFAAIVRDTGSAATNYGSSEMHTTASGVHGLR